MIKINNKGDRDTTLNLSGKAKEWTDGVFHLESDEEVSISITVGCPSCTKIVSYSRVLKPGTVESVKYQVKQNGTGVFNMMIQIKTDNVVVKNITIKYISV